ncbi:tRNA uridine-5-carboxymethylaminomethyl(34) synthesis GTPase MnmE [Legionella israelensis]|uniref:tRNA modification GTPase MnmE n=1 Tax=Legionella israelensis TaxID=454 RepID=A0A0W0V2C4_9GAMM|nr:tRNA uridine-5-carboxymethylaminomethyl(34) synthesis GTPase MnmE [Legionella israelensis]KTD14045.1 tRNA modification GTPase TrmE [Legionella israelensis]QBS09697.1 tRNA uridine-5-carboxymethylaminomethyl(34) synthesis GTPase MnmE [Legionella israelensis]SCY04554.1 tRNA modification GTPase trmE [Legionella israelensis DSM 19235]STX60637.1 GTP binding protein in thiophene and furan oxidation (GTPase) [Legionella israelensis]
MMETTIVAVATPPGRGGVSILRISGPQALAIAGQICQLNNIQPRTAYFTGFYQQNRQLIDQGIALYFKAPHSFTGEDVIELQAHGSPVIMDMLLKECVQLGAELAKPGEFSERAFLNDKMDLSQAEAIADLIHASSETAARMALRSLQGDFSKKIHALNEQLVHLRMYVEAAIDFPEEEIDFLNDGRISLMLETVLTELQSIRAQAHQGTLLREGLSVVIAGRPNAGKSTLINHLAGKEVAIVTDVAGTTRDVMREHILLDDIPIHIIDTAGIHDSADQVEKEGIRRAWQEVSRADCVLLVIDLAADEPYALLTKEVKAALPEHVPVITVFNKIDKMKLNAKVERNQIYLSAKSGEGLNALKQKIKDIAGYQPEEGQFLARRRHLQALDEAKQLLMNGQRQLSEHKAGELLAEDLRLAHQALGEITGEFTSDDLLGKIFSSFCIGK